MEETEQPASSNQGPDPIKGIFPFDDYLKCIQGVLEDMNRFQIHQSPIYPQLLNSSNDNDVTLTLELLWEIQRTESFVGLLSRALHRQRSRITPASTKSLSPPPSQDSKNKIKQKRRMQLAQVTVMWMKIHCLQVIQNDLASIRVQPHRFSASQQILNIYFGLTASDYHQTTSQPYLSRLLVTPSGAAAYIEAADALREIWVKLTDPQPGDHSAASTLEIPELLAQVCDLAKTLEISTESPSKLTELTKSCVDRLVQRTIDWLSYAHQDAAKLAKKVSLLRPQPSVSGANACHPISLISGHQTSPNPEDSDPQLFDKLSTTNTLEIVGHTTIPIGKRGLQVDPTEPHSKNQSNIINLGASAEFEPTNVQIPCDLQEPLNSDASTDHQGPPFQDLHSKSVSTDGQSTLRVINLDDDSPVSPSRKDPERQNLEISPEQEITLIQDQSQPSGRKDSHQAHSESLSISQYKKDNISPQDPPLPSQKLHADSLPFEHDDPANHADSAINLQIVANHEPLSSQQQSHLIHESLVPFAKNDDNLIDTTSGSEGFYPPNHEPQSSDQDKIINIHDCLPTSPQKDNSSNQNSPSIRSNHATDLERTENNPQSSPQKDNASNLASPQKEPHPTVQPSTTMQEIPPIHESLQPPKQAHTSTSNNEGPQSSPAHPHPDESFLSILIVQPSTTTSPVVTECIQKDRVTCPPKFHNKLLGPEKRTFSQLRHSMGPQTIVYDGDNMSKTYSTSKLNNKRRYRSTDGVTEPLQKQIKLDSNFENDPINSKVTTKIIEKLAKNSHLSAALQQAKEKAIMRRSQIHQKPIVLDDQYCTKYNIDSNSLNQAAANQQNQFTDSVDDLQSSGTVTPDLDSALFQKLKDNAAKFVKEDSFLANMMKHFFGK